MAKTTELFNIRNGRPGLDLHDGQQRVMDSRRRFVFMLAGTQSGKTSLGSWWLYREIGLTCKNSDGTWMDKGGDFLAVTSNYDLFSMKMLPEMLKVFVRILGIGKYWSQKRVIELKNPVTNRFEAQSGQDVDNMWGRIILRSARAGKAGKGKGDNISVTSLEAGTAKAAWLDECGMDDFTLEAWEAIRRRLALHRGRVLGTTTLYNYGWMKKEIYDRWLQGDAGVEVISFDSIMNPAFPTEEYYEMKGKMPGWKFDLQYRGIYTKPAGVIFADFDEARAVIAPHFIPREALVLVGLDFGAINTASVWAYIDKGMVTVFMDTLEGNVTTRGHVARMNERGEYFDAVQYVGGAKSEKQYRMDWTDAGIYVREPAVAEVESGIDKITELMKGDRLRITSACTGLLQEIREYSRVVNALGEPTTEIKDKNTYHRVDALRYLCTLIRTTESDTFSRPKEGGARPEKKDVAPRLPFGRQKIPRLR